MTTNFGIRRLGHALTILKKTLLFCSQKLKKLVIRNAERKPNGKIPNTLHYTTVCKCAQDKRELQMSALPYLA